MCYSLQLKCIIVEQLDLTLMKQHIFGENKSYKSLILFKNGINVYTVLIQIFS